MQEGTLVYSFLECTDASSKLCFPPIIILHFSQQSIQVRGIGGLVDSDLIFIYLDISSQGTGSLCNLKIFLERRKRNTLWKFKSLNNSYL